jgi:beta-glucosidase/6-phospho-beta-glucosidase/beta-galactosidase
MMEKDFMWIAGIEDTFVTKTDRTSSRSMDEYELTQHYSNWEKDLEIIANTGFKYVRYGIPWYTVNPEKGRFDFSWTDRVFDFMGERSLIPIVDFIHYGTPHWMDNGFLNSCFPDYMADYELEVLERYRKSIDLFTPMNEPFITQEFCGRLSVWPPYLSGDDGFVKLLISTAKGIMKSVSSIKRELPDKYALHVEASGIFFSAERELQDEVRKMNEMRYLTYDLIQGKVDTKHCLFDYLCRNGVGREDLDWFMENKITVDGFGVNYYPQLSVFKVSKEKGKVRTTPFYGGTDYLEKLILSYHERYGGPIFLTETSINGEPDHQILWWRESLTLVEDLIDRGIDLRGYTWFPAIDLINWDYRYGSEPVEKYVETMGFVNLKMDPSRQFRRSTGELAAVMRNDLRGEE